MMKIFAPEYEHNRGHLPLWFSTRELAQAWIDRNIAEESYRKLWHIRAAELSTQGGEE